MTKNSVKKLSVLGLVLIAASAVTAAIIPSKDTKSSDERGLYGASSDGVNSHTCIPGVGNNCNVTADSGTTDIEGTIDNTTTVND